MLEPLSYLTGLVSLPVLALLLFFIIETVTVAYDSDIIATVILLAFGALGVWMSWISVDWALVHWVRIAMAVGAYVPIGIGWTVIKWWFYLKAEYRLAEIYIRVNGCVPSYDYPPQVSNHKRDIMRWLAWWPFSFVGTLLNDPLRRFFQMIYRHLGKVLQRMSDRIFSHLVVPDAPPRKGGNG